MVNVCEFFYQNCVLPSNLYQAIITVGIVRACLSLCLKTTFEEGSIHAMDELFAMCGSTNTSAIKLQLLYRSWHNLLYQHKHFSCTVAQLEVFPKNSLLKTQAT